ncbi:MAG: hypothetical protein PHC39_04655 [Proteiniphilum sp.]|nr:hypothetical protein [Proteiniphilum sp.]
MSTSGHYTRYINQYPGWSDNCDTMHQPVNDGTYDCEKCGSDKACNLKDRKEEYCSKQIGYFQVEHNAGNTSSWCTYSDNHYDNRTGKRQFPWDVYRMPVYDYTGKKAIQNVLDFMAEFPREKLFDLLFKTRFYNRSYADYFEIYLEVP